MINEKLDDLEDLIDGKPVVSILEGGGFNKHDEFVKQEFEILGDVDEINSENSDNFEENNNKIREISIDN